MIRNKECYYLAEKELSALLKEIMTKYHFHFYWLNCLRYFAAVNKRESYKKAFENKIFVTL